MASASARRRASGSKARRNASAAFWARSHPSGRNSAGRAAHISAASASGSSRLTRSMAVATASRSRASRASSVGLISPRARRRASGGHRRSRRARFARRLSSGTPEASATDPSASSSCCSLVSVTWCSWTLRPIRAQGASREGRFDASEEELDVDARAETRRASCPSQTPTSDARRASGRRARSDRCATGRDDPKVDRRERRAEDGAPAILAAPCACIARCAGKSSSLVVTKACAG